MEQSLGTGRKHFSNTHLGLHGAGTAGSGYKPQLPAAPTGKGAWRGGGLHNGEAPSEGWDHPRGWGDPEGWDHPRGWDHPKGRDDPKDWGDPKDWDRPKSWDDPEGWDHPKGWDHPGSAGSALGRALGLAPAVHALVEQQVGAGCQHLVQAGPAHGLVRDPEPLAAAGARRAPEGDEVSRVHVPVVHHHGHQAVQVQRGPALRECSKWESSWGH